MNAELQFIMDYYQKSWDNLILVIGGTGAFLGIILPALMIIFYHKGNDNYKKKLDRNIERQNDEIDKHISDSTNKIDEKTTSFESRIVKVEKEVRSLTGNMFFAQAQSASDTFLKIICFLYAYVSYIEAKDTFSMTMTYNCLLPYLQENQSKVKHSFSTELLNMVKMTVEKIIYGLNQLNDDMYCKYQINIFEDYRRRLDE